MTMSIETLLLHLTNEFKIIQMMGPYGPRRPLNIPEPPPMFEHDLPSQEYEISLVMSRDWLKGKPTGNLVFLTSKYKAFR